jgi:hypothetical protein
MAKTASLNLPQSPDYETLPSFHRLGLWQGLLIGFGIVIPFWLPKLIILARLPLQFPYGGIIVSSVAIFLLCAATGWLTSHMRRVSLVMISWLVTAVLICVSLGYLPPAGNNWAIWLADGRFANLSIFQPPGHLFWWSYVIAGLLLIVLLTLMGVLQNINLVKAHQELGNGRLNRKATFILLLPALLASLGAAVIPDLSGGAPRGALSYTHQGIQTARSYDGDLFWFSQDSGFNYNALESVLDQLDGSYTLLVNEIDPSWSSIVVTAHFDSGAWVNCRVNSDQRKATYLSFCFDAAPLFTEGLNYLLNGETPPEACRRCEIMADSNWQQWLQERVNRFDTTPKWERLAQYGRFTFMQATTDSGYSITCQLEGAEDVQVVSCEENQ